MCSKMTTTNQVRREKEVHRRRGQYTASRTLDKRVKARFDTFDSAVDTGPRFLGISANYGPAQMDLKLRSPYCKAEHSSL